MLHIFLLSVDVKQHEDYVSGLCVCVNWYWFNRLRFSLPCFCPWKQAIVFYRKLAHTHTHTNIHPAIRSFHSHPTISSAVLYISSVSSFLISFVINNLFSRLLHKGFESSRVLSHVLHAKLIIGNWTWLLIITKTIRHSSECLNQFYC